MLGRGGTVDQCVDYPLPGTDGAAWHDTTGSSYTCAYYAKDGKCAAFGARTLPDAYWKRAMCVQVTCSKTPRE